VADLSYLRQFQQYRSHPQLRANAEFIRVYTVDNEVFAERTRLQFEALGAHELDVGVRQQTDLTMPLSRMRIVFHAIVLQKLRRRNFVLGDAFLDRNANVQ